MNFISMVVIFINLAQIIYNFKSVNSGKDFDPEVE